MHVLRDCNVNPVHSALQKNTTHTPFVLFSHLSDDFAPAQWEEVDIADVELAASNNNDFIGYYNIEDAMRTDEEDDDVNEGKDGKDDKAKVQLLLPDRKPMTVKDWKRMPRLPRSVKCPNLVITQYYARGMSRHLEITNFGSKTIDFSKTPVFLGTWMNSDRRGFTRAKKDRGKRVDIHAFDFVVGGALALVTFICDVFCVVP
jgi:hypothetical protein